jgi:hypothetical protein
MTVFGGSGVWFDGWVVVASVVGAGGADDEGDFGCHFFRSGVAVGGGCVSAGFGVSVCVIS